MTHDAPEMFPIGDTVVTFTAIDDGGNRTSQTSIFTVADTTGPMVTVPSEIEVEANTIGGHLVSSQTIAALLAQTSAANAVQESVAITHDAPTLLPLGETVVTFTTTTAQATLRRYHRETATQIRH